MTSDQVFSELRHGDMKLESCPFCGGAADWAMEPTCTVFCGDCGICYEGDSLADVVARWQRRHGLDEAFGLGYAEGVCDGGEP